MARQLKRDRATSPRKSATQERSRATVDALLSATARVLVKEGYDRASTNKVAEAAGVSIGSLYQYFPSKEALVSAVIQRHIGEDVCLAVVGVQTRDAEHRMRLRVWHRMRHRVWHRGGHQCRLPR